MLGKCCGSKGLHDPHRACKLPTNHLLGTAKAEVSHKRAGWASLVRDAGVYWG